MAGKRLSEAVHEYIRMSTVKKGSADHNTVKTDRIMLEMFTRMVGDRVTSNITPEHVEAWFYGPGGMRDEHIVESRRAGSTRLAPPISESTHNHYRSRLGTFFKWCAQRGYVKRDLMVNTEPLKVKRQPRLQVSPVTLLTFLDAATCERDRCYLATAMNTGLRSIEIRSLHVGDVDLDGGNLAVRISKTGDADMQPITAELDVELRRWLIAYARDLERPLRDDDYLFPARRGGLIHHYERDEEGRPYAVRRPFTLQPDRPVSRTHEIVKGALAACGLPTYKEGTHSVRRSVARAYFEAVSQEKGDVAALRETAALLHHSSVTTTELYLGLTPEKNARDRRMRGKSFLTDMVSGDNVVPIRRSGGGE